MKIFKIDPDKKLRLGMLKDMLAEDSVLELSPSAVKKIRQCREYLDKKLAASSGPVYGINTGFGFLHDKQVHHKDLEKLQENMVMSHACGTGDEVPEEIVRLMMLLKIAALSKGYSGVQEATVERLIFFFNERITPVVFQQGSLGASGDLAPLAHLSLPLIGRGEVHYKGRRMDSAKLHRQLGMEALSFRSKEALALLNGTQFMSAYASLCLTGAFRLCDWADMAGAVSLDAFGCRSDPYHEKIQKIRPHPGQAAVAKNIRDLLKGSELLKSKKQQVQDPYSFRCIPQVHGASRDAIAHVAGTVETEINSVTDNPTLFPEDDIIISAGNFHGQPLALGLDYLAIALSELGSISERRTYQLISGQRGLPVFLVSNPGLNSGLMIPQYTAASVVSQNKQLCSPASVDSIVSSNGQEDHVSMGANAATKCYSVMQNLERILAIELLNASQALDFRRPSRSSPRIEKMIKEYRKKVPFIGNDKVLYPEINVSVEFLRSYFPVL